jgi:hypothetical protein
MGRGPEGDSFLGSDASGRYNALESFIADFWGAYNLSGNAFIKSRQIIDKGW